MSTLKLTAASGGGTVALKGPATTTGNAALELTVPGAESGELVTKDSDDSLVNVQGINGGQISPRNRIINGNFDIWQRSTSTTFGAGTTYVADRWNCGGAASTTVSRQAFTLGQTDVPYEPKYYLQSAWTANSQNYEIAQKIEGVRTLAGQKITASFWIKRSTGTIGLGARLVQYFGTGGSPSALVITSLGTPTLTTSWQKLTYTVDVPSISGKTIGSNNDDSLWFSLQVNNANTGTIQLAQVQVEKGASATNYELKSHADELLSCQRFYAKTYNSDIMAGTDFNNDINAKRGMIFVYRQRDNNYTAFTYQHPVEMRAVPTMTTYSMAGTSGKFSSTTTDTTAGTNAAHNGTKMSMAYGTATAADDCYCHFVVEAEL